MTDKVLNFMFAANLSEDALTHISEDGEPEEVEEAPEELGEEE